MPEKSIDDQIREEIERIARDVIDWEQSKATDGGFKPHWKPRFDSQNFIADGKKRVRPLDWQVYFDLQMTRGATQKETQDLNWEFEDPARGMTERKAENEARFRHFTNYFSLSAETTILELGMRSGHFLYFLRAHGYSHTVGVDCVRLNVLWCLKNGFDVLQADAHELTAHFEAETFDAIFAYHVLEHCFDPAKVLQECRAILKPSGAIHIEIPLGEANLQLAHCYSFSRRELPRLLRRNGFNVLDYLHDGPRSGGIERIVAQKRP